MWDGTVTVSARLLPRRGMRRLVWGIATVLIVMAGYGRIYMGAHCPSDVLGGYLWALCIALMLLGAARVAGVRPSPTVVGTGNGVVVPTK